MTPVCRQGRELLPWRPALLPCQSCGVSVWGLRMWASRVLLLVGHWDLDKLCQFPAQSDKVTREGRLSWRCPMCLPSVATATESRRVKLAAVCRWLRKPLQKGCLTTAGSLDSEEAVQLWREKVGAPASLLLLYLLGFLISVSGSFLLSVLQAQSLGIILDSCPALTYHVCSSANPAGPTIRIYPGSDHDSPPPLFPRALPPHAMCELLPRPPNWAL